MIFSWIRRIKLLEVNNQFDLYSVFIFLSFLCFTGAIHIEVYIWISSGHHYHVHADVRERDFASWHSRQFGIYTGSRWETRYFDRVHDRSVSFSEKSRPRLFGGTMPVSGYFYLATGIPLSLDALQHQAKSHKLSCSIERQRGCLQGGR